MDRRSRSSLALLLLYSLGLLLPPRAEPVLPGSDTCAWPAEICAPHVIAAPATAMAPALVAKGVQAAVDAVRPLHGSPDRLRNSDDPASATGAARDAARATAATLEHQDIRTALLEAGIGLRSSPSRAPPVLI